MDDLPISKTRVIPARDLAWTASRSSGPGGQNVNKVNTKIDLRFDLAGTAALTSAEKGRLRALAGSRLDSDGKVLIVSQATATQSRNIEDARERLQALVAQALVRPKTRRPTKPSRGSKERRLDAKKRNSERKRGRGRVSDD